MDFKSLGRMVGKWNKNTDLPQGVRNAVADAVDAVAKILGDIEEFADGFVNTDEDEPVSRYDTLLTSHIDDISYDDLAWGIVQWTESPTKRAAVMKMNASDFPRWEDVLMEWFEEARESHLRAKK